MNSCGSLLLQQCSRTFRTCSRGSLTTSHGLSQCLLTSGSHLSQSNGRVILQVRASSSWTLSRRASSAIPSLRQRRPIVNGKPIAFHVTELKDEAVRPSRSSNVQTNERKYDSDLIVVLDMDECLIHSQFFNPSDANVYAHQIARRDACKNNRSVDDQDEQQQQQQQQQEVETFNFTLPDGDLVRVNKRPFLDEFLDEITSKYETHIFTAAMEVYAGPLLDILDPDGTKFARRWFRESCFFDSKTRAYVKNLNGLPLVRRSLVQNQQQQEKELPRVVLVDNNPLSFLANPSNGILVSSFFNDPSDKTLPAVIDLIKELDPLDDVRPVLDSKFGLKDALAEITGGKHNMIRKESEVEDSVAAIF